MKCINSGHSLHCEDNRGRRKKTIRCGLSTTKIGFFFYKKEKKKIQNGLNWENMQTYFEIFLPGYPLKLFSYQKHTFKTILDHSECAYRKCKKNAYFFLKDHKKRFCRTTGPQLIGVLFFMHSIPHSKENTSKLFNKRPIKPPPPISISMVLNKQKI